MGIDQSAIGFAEFVVILFFVFGLWWFLSFLPGKLKLATTACLLVCAPLAKSPSIPRTTPVAPTMIQREAAVLL